MCTAVSWGEKNRYFGRNLDLEYHYKEEVVVLPRNYTLVFKKMPAVAKHYGFMGMASVENGYPLFYDATNEYGLSAAALNFVGSAAFCEPKKDALNIAPYEFIPLILAKCKSVDEAIPYIRKMNFIRYPFNSSLPLPKLHFFLADRERRVAVEPIRDRILVCNDPFGVLTNEPPFPYHEKNVANYINVSPYEPKNRFSEAYQIEAYSRGMGGVGLPGDFSSASRFARTAFVSANAVYKENEEENVAQFFHILSSAEVVEGCVRIDGGNVKTVYSSCIDTERGVYYWRTYESLSMSAVELKESQLEGKELLRTPLF